MYSEIGRFPLWGIPALYRRHYPEEARRGLIALCISEMVALAPALRGRGISHFKKDCRSISHANVDISILHKDDDKRRRTGRRSHLMRTQCQRCPRNRLGLNWSVAMFLNSAVSFPELTTVALFRLEMRKLCARRPFLVTLSILSRPQKLLDATKIHPMRRLS